MRAIARGLVTAILVLGVASRQLNSSVLQTFKPSLTFSGVNRVEDYPELFVPTAADTQLFPAPNASSQSSVPAAPAHIVLCALVKNQNSGIREWVFYHHWLGFDRIYLYDHNSSNPLSADLDDWITSGVVVYQRIDHNSTGNGGFPTSAQAHAYSDCLARSQRAHHTWAAFIDANEFLILGNSTAPRSLPALLQDYEAFGGLAINWRVFGTSGHIDYPQRPVLKAYTKCIPDSTRSRNMHVKTIAYVSRTQGIGPSPHVFRYQRGYYSVTETYATCTTPLCVPVSTTRVAVHHYTKSLAEYRRKLVLEGELGAWQRRKPRRLRSGKRLKPEMPLIFSVDRLATEDCLQGVQAFEACCGHLPGLQPLQEGVAKAAGAEGTAGVSGQGGLNETQAGVAGANRTAAGAKVAAGVRGQGGFDGTAAGAGGPNGTVAGATGAGGESGTVAMERNTGGRRGEQLAAGGVPSTSRAGT